MIYTLGIDPGLSGAVALYGADGTLAVWDMPTLELTKGGKVRRRIDLHALAALMTGLSASAPAMCALEDLSGRPASFRNARGETVAQRGQFEQGWNACAPAALCAACAIPFTMLAPAAWKPSLGVPADKNGARLRASQLMPAHAGKWCRVKDDGRAEAALLAYLAMQRIGK